MTHHYDASLRNMALQRLILTTTIDTAQNAHPRLVQYHASWSTSTT